MGASMPEKRWKRDQSVPALFAEHYNTAMGELAPRVAEYLRPVLGNVNVSKDEQRRRFWQTAPGWTPEREAELLALGASREDVGLRKYPWREIDAKADGRADDDRAQVKWMQEMADLGPPEPDQLEALAPAPEPTEQQGGVPPLQPDPAVGAAMPAPQMAAAPAPVPPMEGAV